MRLGLEILKENGLFWKTKINILISWYLETFTAVKTAKTEKNISKICLMACSLYSSGYTLFKSLLYTNRLFILNIKTLYYHISGVTYGKRILKYLTFTLKDEIY